MCIIRKIGSRLDRRRRHRVDFAFGVALAELRAWRKANNLPGGLHVLPGYFMGRRERHLLEQALDQLPATTSAE
ncbi:hypothetical protein FJW08_19150 [Mesorhizobium sp. B3-2-1]|uniref:hypothetical protein n=1 Tax=Mesorhizobium sp. B3-2-1 TaxID=2589891 RepID=UPI001126CB8E|nr:hypothetical protein [Mesorhizobium sp. B3-2-1]TPI28846.1 hypothetical protein FJW08_19150 [Mesorhizobium sp. B3-2-1]